MNGRAHEAPITTLLRRCRARMEPPAAYARRHSGGGSGIPQDQVAILANISSVYYQKIEKGGPTKPSEEVLNDIAAALNMTDEERYALFVFSRRTPPPARAAWAPSGAPWQETYEHFQVATYICRHDWQLVWANRAFEALCPIPLIPGTTNIMALTVLEPEARETWMVDWRRSWADPMLFQLLLARALFPADPVINDLIARVEADPLAAPVWHDLDMPPAQASGSLRLLRLGGVAVPTRLLQSSPNDQPTWKIVHVIPSPTRPAHPCPQRTEGPTTPASRT